jgi:Ca2+-binding RTX toxin-like protein
MAILNVGAGQTFTTIQDAIAAASAGDTISVAAGTYTGDITVDKQLFFEGAQLGIAGTDAARAPVLTGGGALTGAGAGEAVITGRFIVNAGVDDVRVDGFAFFNNVNNFNPARIDVKGDNFTFQNNQFLDVTPGSVGNILVGGTPDLNNPPQGGGATFDDNLFQKATGTGNPTLQLHGPDVTFTNNTVINGPLFLTPLPNASNKPNAPEMSDQTLIVTGNTFTNSFRSGLGFVMGDFANLGTSDITVQQAIADGNLLISGNTFNGAAVNVITGPDFDDDMSALATEFADEIRGQDGDDTLVGLAGNDTLNGQDGDDSLRGDIGDDTLIGGIGTDWASYANASGNVTVDLSAAQPRSFGADGNDSLSSIENVLGGNGNDSILGDGLANLLDGGNGNDTLDGGEGDDSLYGGAGNDWASYANAGGAVTVDLSAGTSSGADGNDDLTEIENVLGGIGNDSILGDGQANVLDGGAGNDSIFGGAGNDTVIGGQGRDSLDGGTDIDLVDFSAVTGNITKNTFSNQFNVSGVGSSTLVGFERFLLGSGNDQVFLNQSTDNTVDGGAGDDGIFTGFGNDSVFSGIGNDAVVGRVGDDTLDGGIGDDELFGEEGNDSLLGGDGEDSLDGFTGDDTLDGGAGNDWASYLNAGGAVTVDLSAGTSSGADGNDDLTEIENVVGGIGNDSILGDGLNNRLDGGNGDDRLDGGAGNDALNGGAGNDTVIGGQGFDSLDGGTDIDLVDFSAVTGDIFKNGTSNNFDFDGVSARVVGFERFLLGSGNDFVFFGTATQSATLDGGVGNDVIVSGSGDDSLFGGTGNDFLNGGEGNDTLDGGIGDDVLSDDGGNDSIFGGVGNDELTHFDFGGAAADATLDGGEGDDTLDGGAGNDWASYANAGGAVTVDLSAGTSSGADGSDDLKGIENVLGGIGNDSILGDGLNNVLDGGNGDDTVLSFVGDDSVVGGDGSDSLIGNEGADTLLGGTGNDTLLGNEQADSLAGGDNNDLLQGGQDTDTLDGGAGDDTLAGGTGENRLTGGDGNDFASYAAAGAGVLVDLGAAQANAQGTDIDDQLFGIEGVIGSNHNDELRGDALDNTLYGGGGSDTLSGGGGNDWLDFGAGSDSYTFLTSAASGERQTLIGDGDNIFGNGIGNDILDLGVGWVAGETADGFINYQHVAGGVTTNLWTQGWEQVVCFAEGTRIVTPNGEAAVENLRAGDMVLAMRDGQAGFEPLRWVGSMDIAVPRNAAMAAKTAPILIKAGAIAPGMPARDLRVSPDHAMEVDGHLIPASHLVNGESIVQEVWCKRVRYFHLELEAHGLLLSEGTWSESYLDDGNRHAFNNAALTGLFLDFEAGRSKGEYDHVACLPVLRRGLKLDEIHGRIALRAQELARATKRQGRR